MAAGELQGRREHVLNSGRIDVDRRGMEQVEVGAPLCSP
jgi:hypothetical protein